MGISAQLTAAFALTSLVGALMLAYGVSARMLQQRMVRCRTCGSPHHTCDRNRD